MKFENIPGTGPGEEVGVHIAVKSTPRVNDSSGADARAEKRGRNGTSGAAHQQVTSSGLRRRSIGNRLHAAEGGISVFENRSRDGSLKRPLGDAPRGIIFRFPVARSNFLSIIRGIRRIIPSPRGAVEKSDRRSGRRESCPVQWTLRLRRHADPLVIRVLRRSMRSRERRRDLGNKWNGDLTRLTTP